MDVNIEGKGLVHIDKNIGIPVWKLIEHVSDLIPLVYLMDLFGRNFTPDETSKGIKDMVVSSVRDGCVFANDFLDLLEVKILYSEGQKDMQLMKALYCFQVKNDVFKAFYPNSINDLVDDYLINARHLICLEKGDAQERIDRSGYASFINGKSKFARINPTLFNGIEDKLCLTHDNVNDFRGYSNQIALKYVRRSGRFVYDPLDCALDQDYFIPLKNAIFDMFFESNLSSGKNLWDELSDPESIFKLMVIERLKKDRYCNSCATRTIDEVFLKKDPIDHELFFKFV